MTDNPSKVRKYVTADTWRHGLRWNRMTPAGQAPRRYRVADGLYNYLTDFDRYLDYNGFDEATSEMDTSFLRQPRDHGCRPIGRGQYTKLRWMADR